MKTEAEAIIQIAQEATKAEIININGRTYTTRSLHPVSENSPPATITVNTITGFIDSVMQLINEGNPPAFIQVEDEAGITAIGPIDPVTGHRPELIKAVPKLPRAFPFNDWMDPETFVISAQANMDNSGDRAAVLALAGNMKDEAANMVADDGITQTVTVKKGISLEAAVKIPNPVMLAPFRTFPEIDQPLSPYILRARRRSNDGPQLALFTVGDGMWRVETMAEIAKALAAKVKDIKVIS